MTVYRPTTLRLASRHCPRAVDYYEQRRPQFRDHFAVGIAAHAVLEALGRASTAPAADVADVVVRQLVTVGRTFDGEKEPPLSLEAAIEGRDLALAWAADHPLSPSAHYELGAGFDARWRPVGYDSTEARFRLIFDVLDLAEESDEESAATGLLVRDYKTSWATDASELDTLQMKAQAVCAWAMNSRVMELAKGARMEELVERPSFIRQEVVNLRTRQTFTRDLWMHAAGEGQELIGRWRRDLELAMDALDQMATPTACRRCDECQGQHHWLPVCPDDEEEYDPDTEALPRWECKHCDATLPYDPDTDSGLPVSQVPRSLRPARPGAGCMGCPWVTSCAPAQDFIEASMIGSSASPAALAAAFAVADGQRAALFPLVKAATEDLTVELAGGVRVGTEGVPGREPIEDVGLALWERWQSGGGEIRGLLKAMSPGLGVTAVESVAKTLHGGRDKVERELRQELVERMTVPVVRPRFGIHQGKGAGNG